MSLVHLRIIAEITQKVVEEGVLTGGAAKGQLWPQIVADTLGIPLRIPVVEESTALGAAICAGVGAGFWDSLEEAASAVASFGPTVSPDPKAQASYRDLA